jgi:hypothetical protein
MKSLWKEFQIILSGELEAAQRLCQHLKTQESMIRRNQSKELVASMRQAGELAEILAHYESQRAQWMESNGTRLQQILNNKEPESGLRDRLQSVADSLKNVLTEVNNRTLNNAELLARMVERGRHILQEIAKAAGMENQVNSVGEEKPPSLFVDQRI